MPADTLAERAELVDYLHMQLSLAGLTLPRAAKSSSRVAESLLATMREKNRLLSAHRSGISYRIENFLSSHFGDAPVDEPMDLPHPTLCLDRHGMARLLSLPAEGDAFSNDLLSSFRVYNGVVHNPRADRRTTQGTFHICEGGLPVPADKCSVPKGVFARLFQNALQPPDEMLQLPYLSTQGGANKTFVSLFLRPLVCPSVSGFCRHKTMETLFLVPGGLVSNLDFVESIFGNAGDPLLPENDSGLDVLHWSGHTGCVILAPHLTKVTKRELGLPIWEDATPRQQRDGMCYRDENEKYNDGNAFKVTCRTDAGVIVTLIADNYFGYCKKEVKTQLSYAANLMGNVEEEHAGGTLAFPSWALGDEFQVNSQRYNHRTFDDIQRDYSDFIDCRPEGYGVDRFYDRLIYIPEDSHASLHDQRIRWQRAGKEESLPLEPGKVYMAPSGYRIQMEKHPTAPSWRLIGTGGDGIVCHKPCTVSGGGKSEISKSLRDYMISGPIFVNDLDADFSKLDEIFSKDYSTRWLATSAEKPDYSDRASRPVLDSRRSLGSVIKLLTPSRDYNSEYNDWLRKIPGSIYAMAFIIKRFCKPEWGGNWKQYFSVDVINGEPGHELKFANRKLVGMYLRVGLDQDRRWQTYKLRQDFAAASKIQLEDDISVSVVVPGEYLVDKLASTGNAERTRLGSGNSYKFVANCEYRLFQRPDDAVHRGLDKQTEKDVAALTNFFCNFEPLTKSQVQEIVSDVMGFDAFTSPMQQMLRDSLKNSANYVVSSAHPRLVDSKPSKNPRYLQDRPDLSAPEERYVSDRSVRLFQGLNSDAPIYQPVAAVLSGRRNNPPDKVAGIRSLAVYNPIHYQELPELFMDYICSLTGKSPSTTGAGSEGALTKSPFNALLPIHDLNAALVSMILTGLGGYSTAAGFIGPDVEVGHDISLLVPELWCRLTADERRPEFLIAEGMLMPVEDFTYQGRLILASRLGYRITSRFVRRFFGRMFDNPDKVFDSRILVPEEQDMESYVEGIEHIVEAQRKVAEAYFEDGSIGFACPPLKAVLSVMAYGNWNGQQIREPEVRRLFTRESMLQSDWYQARLRAKQIADMHLWSRHHKYLSRFCSKHVNDEVTRRLDLQARIAQAEDRMKYFETPEYLKRLQGTLGTDPALVPNLAVANVARTNGPSRA
ncbi:MAG: hypothetical protein KDB03_08900 [Planctomycetales bacterium]|nr:hypothetical protein [Planctomycetales bacterium]